MSSKAISRCQTTSIQEQKQPERLAPKDKSETTLMTMIKSVIGIIPGLLFGSGRESAEIISSKKVEPKYTDLIDLVSEEDEMSTSQKTPCLPKEIVEPTIATTIQKTCKTKERILSEKILPKLENQTVLTSRKKIESKSAKLNRKEQDWLEAFLGTKIDSRLLEKYSINNIDITAAYNLLTSSQSEINVIVGDTRTPLRVESLNLLRSSQWLNDEVINSYLFLTLENKKTLIANSFFFERKDTRLPFRYFKDFQGNTCENPSSMNYLVIPLHENKRNHWTLVAADLKNKKIEYYDSLNGEIPKECELLKQNLIEKGINEKSKKAWVIEKAKQLQQNNHYDCGVFVLATARKWLCQNKFVDFSRDDAPYLRLSILTTLVKHSNSYHP